VRRVEQRRARVAVPAAGEEEGFVARGGREKWRCGVGVESSVDDAHAHKEVGGHAVCSGLDRIGSD
jgi:hypothetical protein